MAWPQIKQKARDSVHQTFLWPAIFQGKGNPTIGVRVHYRVKQFGDIDREGFATTMEDVNYLIVDSREVDVVENDRIFVPLLARMFKCVVLIANEDGIYNKWEVIEVTQ